MLVGTTYQVVDDHLEGVKSTLAAQLQRQYKKYNIFPPADIIRPEFKLTEVKVRPAYRDHAGMYPLSELLELAVPVIYGHTEDGHYECFLPLLQGHFFYYDPAQLDPLVQHFCASYFNQAEPEEVYRMMIMPRPAMEVITLKVNFDRPFDWGNFKKRGDYKVLNRLGEPYPPVRHGRRNISLTPDTAWQLEAQVEEVWEKLTNSKANVVVVGEPGVGKSAVLQQAVRKWMNQLKKQRMTVTCWRLMAERITASSKYLGEWEATCEALVDELNDANGILWVEDLVRLVHIGGEGPEVSVAAFLTPFLQQQRLVLIGEATPQELERLRRRLPVFAACFHVVEIEELSTPQVKTILDQLADYTLKQNKIQLTGEAVDTAYRLLNRFYPYERFPGKAFKLLSQCVSKAQAANQSIVDEDAVFHHFIQQSGMPELFLRDDIRLDTNELQQFFEAKIIGQPTVIQQLCNLVKVFKAGLNNPTKPIATLLFCGPTGVGKTASAQALASYFFGKGQRQSPLIRIDMSEFQSPLQLRRLLGDATDVGQLIKEVREKPFSVLLLDEIEKAHPLIFDTLLNLLDEGVLTDFYGRVTNFRNAIIIMTSNLGADQSQSISFRRPDAGETNYISAIERFFRPEFVNRIDRLLFFKPLTEESVRLIARKELATLNQREGFVKRTLSLSFSDRIVAHLLQIGFDERYGARPLQRAIEQSIVNPIAQWLLEHPEASNGTLQLDYEGGLVIQY